MTSSTADAAREAARDKTNGQFGEQHLADPGSGVLAGTDADIAEVVRLTGAPEHEARTAVQETDSIEAAVRHACQAATVRTFANQASVYRDQLEVLREQVNDAAVQSSVRRLLMRWPDANQIEMCDEMGDGNYTFNVFVGGADVGPLDDFDLTDEMWELSCHIDHHRPELLEKWCVGHGDGGYMAVGLEVDRHTDTLNRAVFDLDLFRDGPAK